MNYVVKRNEVACTKINHIQLYVEQVAKCRIESGAKIVYARERNAGERNDVLW